MNYELGWQGSVLKSSMKINPLAVMNWNWWNDFGFQHLKKEVMCLLKRNSHLAPFIDLNALNIQYLNSERWYWHHFHRYLVWFSVFVVDSKLVNIHDVTKIAKATSNTKAKAILCSLYKNPQGNQSVHSSQMTRVYPLLYLCELTRPC